jgi:hypothetical protein
MSQYFRSMFQKTVNFLRNLMDTPPNSKTYPISAASYPAIPRILGSNEWEKKYKRSREEKKADAPSVHPVVVPDIDPTPPSVSVSLHSPVPSIPPYHPYRFRPSQQRVLRGFNKLPQFHSHTPSPEYVYPFPSPLQEEKKMSTVSMPKPTKASSNVHSPASTSSSHRSKGSKRGAEKVNPGLHSSAHTSISNITSTLLALRGLKPKHPLAETLKRNRSDPPPTPYTLFGHM